MFKDLLRRLGSNGDHIMSILGNIVATLNPLESRPERPKVRSRAQSLAQPDDWLSMVLQHHIQIEVAFAAVEASLDSDIRRAAQKRLSVLLIGHASAEESVIYPALAQIGKETHAITAYMEQATVKLQMSALETRPLMSQDYLDTLEHIRVAVLQHMYEEEGTWFIQLKNKLSVEDQAKLTDRYEDEHYRYVGYDLTAHSQGIPWDAAAYPTEALNSRPPRNMFR
jgi:hemerythrin superfamily protein